MVVFNSGPMPTERELIDPDCVHPRTGIPDIGLQRPPFARVQYYRPSRRATTKSPPKACRPPSPGRPFRFHTTVAEQQTGEMALSVL